MSLMRFIIKITQPGDQEWEISIFPKMAGSSASNGVQDSRLLPPRRIRRVVSGPLAYPQPPENEAQAIASHAPHRHLCTTPHAADIDKVYRSIMARLPNKQQHDAEAFARYLSATLLGNDGWQAICAHADRYGETTPSAPAFQGIELALCFSVSQHDLACLPWEMMFGSSNFLTAEPQRLVAVTRIVSDTASVPDPLPSPLKVLFVVGTDLSDDSIAPGAEYLSLMRSLEAGRVVSFQSRLLLAATLHDLQRQITDWRPSVVHFICHGGYDAQRRQGYLELTAEEERERKPAQRVFAPSLLPALLSAATRPIVVLNACYSGAAVAQQSIPLAAELVQGGLPIVVGMAGRVADTACRFFTRRFYESLLKNESLVTATAEGRRAGFTLLGDPESHIDWIFPTVFLSEQASPKISAAPCVQGKWDRLRQIADKYHTLKQPPIFCDRFTFIAAYQHLMSEQSPYNVIAVEARTQFSDLDTRPRYGKTRLLQELAAHATLDGNIPCLLSLGPHDAVPATPLELAEACTSAIYETYNRFQFPGVDLAALSFECDQLQSVVDGVAPPSDLRTATRNALRGCKSPGDCKAVAAALYADLQVLASAARQSQPEALVLLLIDDVHRFSVAAPGNSPLDLLLNHLLTRDMLTDHGTPFRVVFTYSNPADQVHESALKMLADTIPQKHDYVKSLPLEAFKSSQEYTPNDYRHDEYRMAYQQFLLYRKLVISHSARPDQVAAFYDDLHKAIKGNPARFLAPNEWLEHLLVLYTERWPLLEKADDNDLLQLAATTQKVSNYGR